MSFVLWIKITVSLRLNNGEVLTPLLARKGKEGLVPMTGAFMARMNNLYAPGLGWLMVTIHSRLRGFATAAERCGSIWQAYALQCAIYLFRNGCNLLVVI